jgi:flavin-dependent dehydrogenase
LPSYSCPRAVFDAALLDLVRQHTATDIREDAVLKDLHVAADHVQLLLHNGQELRAALVIGCDGANSVVGRKLLPAPLDRAHHCASVRAYYENVADTASGRTEFFFMKDYLQGYLWIFPVGAGRCNVGLGMLSETVARHKSTSSSCCRSCWPRTRRWQPASQRPGRWGRCAASGCRWAGAAPCR